MHADSQNNLWIGTVNGLSRYNGKYFTNYRADNGLHGNTIWNIQELRDGEILVVTRDGFTYFVDGMPSGSFYDEKIFEKRINKVIADENGNFWIGYSGHGVVFYNKSTGKTKKYTTESGLTSNLVYNLIIDHQGNLVVGYERGVDKLYLDDDNNVIKIKNYGKVEGFEDLQTMHNSIYLEENNNIWFGTPEGIFKYQPGKEEENKIEPITYISGLKLFYDEVDWSDYTDSLSSWFSLPVNLSLPYNKNSLVIQYFGNSLANPEEVKYQFRLIGMEQTWSPSTYRTEAVYTNLEPGDYTFEVQAANSDGYWNENPARFSFTVVPPFWKETWFFVLMVILVLLALKLFNDYRIRANLNKVLTVERIRAEEQVKVRKRMARDFHDNMGNQLASITVFANLINLKLKDKSKEVDDLLKNIEKHTQSLFNGTKDFIWSIDPESDNLIEIFTYIKDFGEDLYEKVPIEFYAENKIHDRQCFNLPSGFSRQIVLIFKEAMTNTLKHAACTEVHFNLELEGENFVLELRDNGKGLSQENIGKGNGFKNMRARARQINCFLEVESNPRKGGTSIKLYGTIESDQTSKMKIF